jgi:hypothetical protein
MKQWTAPNGVEVYSNVEPPPDRLIDRNWLAQRLWSVQFVIKKVVRSFRARRTDGFWYQRAAYQSTLKAELDWTMRVREQAGVEDAVVAYDGLRWGITGTDQGVKFTGGTVSLSKRAGRTHKEWRVVWPEEKWDEVPASLTPVDAVVDALYRAQGLEREEV